MSKFFMYGTEAQELEELMMLVPNFLPRRSGLIVVNRVGKETESSMFERSCTEITEYCKPNVSAENTKRIIEGEFNYEEVIHKCLGKCESYLLHKRLACLVKNNDCNIFFNVTHRNRLQTVCRLQNRSIGHRSPVYLATLFLLTADDRLWCAAKDHVYLDNFDFKKMYLNGINTGGYAIYQMARTIYLGREFIKLNEIADKLLMRKPLCHKL